MTQRHSIPAIDAPGRPAKRNLSRLTLAASADSDVARAPWTPFSEPVRRVTGGAYSDAFNAVRSDYAPKENSFYA